MFLGPAASGGIAKGFGLDRAFLAAGVLAALGGAASLLAFRRTPRA